MTLQEEGLRPAELCVGVSFRRGMRVLTLSGELDASTRQEWARALDAMLADMSPASGLVVDLSSVAYCDAGCAGLLVDAAEYGDCRGRIAVVAPRPIVAKVLDVVAAPWSLPRYPSVTEAVAMLGQKLWRGPRQRPAQSSRHP